MHCYVTVKFATGLTIAIDELFMYSSQHFLLLSLVKLFPLEAVVDVTFSLRLI